MPNPGLQLPLFETTSNWRPPQLSDLPSWKGAKRVGLDIETYDPNLKTTGPSVRTGGYIVGVSFALEGDTHKGAQRAYYLPIRHLGGDNLPIEQVLFYLRSQAREYTGTIVGANFQYDLDFLAEERIVFPNVRHVRDIQIADPLLFELHDSYSLQSIAKRWGFEGKSENLLRRAAADYGLDPKKEMWKLPARYVGEYAADDARLALEIIVKQEEQIERERLWGIYDLESRLQPVLLQMRRHGIRIDQQKLAYIENWALEQERNVCAELTRRTGVVLKVGDVNKKVKLQAVLSQIGVRFRQTASGQAQIDAEFLNQLNHPVAELIISGKKVNKLRTTFVKSIQNHMVNGRIHTTFNQLRHTREQGDSSGARYGRTSSVNPNLQQQPARDEFAKMWRSIYVPDVGVPMMMSADYSQQEPRMLIHFAELTGLEGATKAADAYRRDPRTDNHQMMADMAGIERKKAKNIFLGLCYGMGTGKLAKSLGLPTQTARRSDGSTYLVAGAEGQALFDQFDRAVPFVRKLARRCEARAAQRGYITTLLGRRCHFPVNAMGQFDWTHKALNRLIQGSSADQTKLAMVEIAAAGLPLQLQVHDEVLAGVESREQAEQIATVMRECVQLRVPSQVDIELGPSWGEAA